MDYILLLRPKQWLKNFFIFAALLFSRNLFDAAMLVAAVEAFVIFCLISSGVYVLNDVFDRARDQNHPVKKNRPVASGRMPAGSACLMASVLLGAGLLWSFMVAAGLGLTCLAYVLLMLAYSALLKELVILDIFTIAAGFILRVVAGAEAIVVYLSPWLLLCTVFLSLFIALGKRRHELYLLSQEAAEHRPALNHYSFAFIDQMVAVATSATILSYSLYTFLAPTSKALMGTIPFVLYGLFRYLYVIYQQNGGGAPEEILTKDRPLQIVVLLWVIACFLALYLGPAPGAPVFSWQ